MGRWASKDPIDEEGFRLLSDITKRDWIDATAYGFVGNNTLMFSDSLGLKPWWWPFGEKKTEQERLCELEKELAELYAEKGAAIFLQKYKLLESTEFWPS